MVVVSACMSGTRGSGLLSSIGDMLERCVWYVFGSGRCG